MSSKWFSGNINGACVSGYIDDNLNVGGFSLKNYPINGTINGISVNGMVIDNKISGICLDDRYEPKFTKTTSNNSQYERINIDGGSYGNCYVTRSKKSNSTNEEIKRITKELEELSVDITDNTKIKDANDTINIYKIAIATLGIGTIIALTRIPNSSIESIIKFTLFDGMSFGVFSIALNKKLKQKLNELKRILEENDEKES